MTDHLLARPGPDVTDEHLAAWRDAVTAGGLPNPDRSRWMPLRGGAVNMWEFDVAEYWFADGRAQLVGQNQSGKSTLMTLTTLIMLQGETRRHLIDTFGESGKRFRYYVEPSGQPKDRRDTSASTNRGWVWVEYGRTGEDGTAEFFTLLLYAQAKRGVQDITTSWITCRGTARVRAGIELAAGQAAYEPKHVAAVDGATVHPSGKAYAGYVASELFGIDDPERYKTVLTMLRSLRTPNLGKVLDADFFTGQIRSALPALDKDEVAELAGSWQQVEQLGRDRDDAEAARTAITGYVNRSWRPWADAVLRLHADALLDAAAACDRADQAVTAAKGALGQARRDLTAESGRTTELMTGLERAQSSYSQLLHSSAYGDAIGRANDARRAREAATLAARHASEAQQALTRAQSEHDQAQAAQQRAATTLSTASDTVDAAAGHATAAGQAAGLGPVAAGWASGGDVDRLDAAVTDRRRQVGVLRGLLRIAADAAGAWRLADTIAGTRKAEFTDRQNTAARAATELSEALQHLFDDLERWAARLGGDAPPAAVREQWLQQVTAQAATVRPRQVLTSLLTRDWLEPKVVPLAEQAAQLRAEAAAATSRAITAERDADTLEQAGDPQPPPPSGWVRRTRPSQAPSGGAPLWRLIDPAPDLDAGVLDRVEAALAAAGLLDAWVNADGVWVAGRDGDDVVINPPTPAPAVGDTLAAILTPAGDAGELTAAVTAILAGIGYTSGDGSLAGPVGVAADGRFRTASLHGRAGRADHGAELIGAAARAAARRRQISEMRQSAERERTVAARLTAEASDLAGQVTGLRDVAQDAPSDADVAGAGAALTTANGERDRAQLLHVEAAANARGLRAVADDANAAVVALATEHDLPAAAEALEAVAGHIDTAAEAVSGLRLALQEQQGAQRSVAAAVGAVTTATERLGIAEQTARDLAGEAAVAAESAAEAEASIDRDDQELFTRKKTFEDKIDELKRSIARSHDEGKRLVGIASSAERDWEQALGQQEAAGRARGTAYSGWWVPVDAGLAAARNLQVGEGRDLGDALAQAKAAAQTLRPANWPAPPAEKTVRVSQLMSRIVGNQVAELQALLEASGGRSVSVIEADDSRPLPQVVMTVDASGQQLSPAEAIRQLDDLVAELSDSHDEKLNVMYTELLSSTFIDHLADRLKAVIDLLDEVNVVLSRHPTGADRMTLRLRRHPAAEHAAGYKILKAIEDGVIASETAQDQIRLFLADRLQQAHDLPADDGKGDGKSAVDEWIDRVAGLLDYRAWFDVVCEFRIAGHADDPVRWQPLTKQEHTVDSGGGKAVTLLQPLLATLVTLYSESPRSPRPLWLDEAFVGVDLANQTTMMRMLVDFDLDFLVAGPATLVASAQVPAAAIWHIARAPAPLPGVDLSLTLWAGRTLQIIAVADVSATVLRPARPADAYTGPDLFSTAESGEEVLA
ncbi:SbcC/MukB-like Walker B domain-containing protein [Micromonospora sp. NPDC049060]|uniref:SbcC/MukB-like Walker B domain-containing protein n=1 Tax=Micromonospora sp. NPDC049060 TaxID=3154828 RepID=UPI0033DBF799